MKHPRKYKGTKDSEKEPHPSHVTEEQVISYLSSMSQPESIRQIAHGMELQHHGRRFLPRIIQYLKSRGDVEEIRGGQYRLAESGQLVTFRGKRKEVCGQQRARSMLMRAPSRLAGQARLAEAPIRI